MSRGRRAQRPWYVDSVRGSDGNQGKSPGDALRTIAAVSPKIRTGDVVALACGSHWREALLLPDHVRVAAYGTGVRPLLDCSDPVPAANWQKTGGLTNVYQAEVDLDGNDSPLWVSVWESDVRLVRASSTADCDATPGSYYPAADYGPSIVLYVHASDHSDPGSNGKTYEYSKRRFGLMGSTGISVRGIHTRRNLHCNGSLSVYWYGSLTDCVASEGNKHNVYVGPGSVLSNVEADRAYFTSDAFMFVHNGANPANANITYLNCYAHDFTGPSASGFGGHSNDTGKFGTVTWRGCTVANCSRGFDSGDAQVTQLIGCATNNPDPEWGAAALYATSPVVLVDGCQLTGRAANGRAIQADAPGMAVTVRNSTLGGNSAVFESQPNVNLVLENNTVNTDGFCVYANGVGFTLHARGNLFQTPQLYYYFDKGGSADSDYNTFVDPGPWPRFEMPAGTRWNLEAWKAAGQDQHSTP